MVFLGGGDKKVESQKLDWNAKSKVGSTDYIKHKPGGGNVKVRKRSYSRGFEIVITLNQCAFITFCRAREE